MVRHPRIVFALALVAASSAIPASAQECVEGRVSTAETDGRCCWPGQSWSDAQGRCSGPPSCPDGLVADGDRCVLPMLVFPAMPGAYGSEPGASVPSPTGGPSASLPMQLTSTPVTSTMWPETPPDLEHALREPRLVGGTDEGLLLGGLLTLAGGYLTSIVFALVDQAAQNCMSFGGGFTSGGPRGCDSWPFAFIPYAGGLISGFTVSASNSFRTNVALAFAIQLPMAALQILGTILTGIAVFGSTEDAVPARAVEIGDVEISVAPYGSETEGGVWLDVRF